MTPSVHGGVVRLPVYLKYPYRFATLAFGKIALNAKYPVSYAVLKRVNLFIDYSIPTFYTVHIIKDYNLPVYHLQLASKVHLKPYYFDHLSFK